MGNERFQKPFIPLNDYIPYSHFRTIESFSMRKARSESYAEIEVKDEFKKQLSFKVPWDGRLFACVRHTEAFLKLLSDNGIEPKQIKVISFEDWDDRFMLEIETVNHKQDVSFFVTNNEMIKLLENCCRIEEQK